MGLLSEQSTEQHLLTPVHATRKYVIATALYWFGITNLLYYLLYNKTLLTPGIINEGSILITGFLPAFATAGTFIRFKKNCRIGVPVWGGYALYLLLFGIREFNASFAFFVMLIALASMCITHMIGVLSRTVINTNNLLIRITLMLLPIITMLYWKTLPL